jgi:AGCS family alanine or glycine:cation symporter
MALIFGVMLVISSFATGNTIQSFSVADQFRSAFNIPTWITGLIVASIIAMVILGGIKRIGRVASILAPGMCLLYILAGLTILVMNYNTLPETFATIFTSAFSKSAKIGGFAGSSFLFMMVWGIKRGLFSNEAGQGSAPIAHAAAKTDEPVREGVVAMLGPFIDTLMVCTITGLVIVTTGVWKEKFPTDIHVNQQAAITVVEEGGEVGVNTVINGKVLTSSSFEVIDGEPRDVTLIRNHSIIDNAVVLFNDQPYTGSVLIDDKGEMHLTKDGNLNISGEMMENGSPLTALAFERGLGRFGKWGALLITISVFFFGISTSISWSYYGDRGVYYLFGKKSIIWYKIIFVVASFLGAIVSLETVWAFGDVAIGFMAIPNLIALMLLSGVVRKEAKTYSAKKHLTYKERIELMKNQNS